MDQNQITAPEILVTAADIIDQRGKLRDKEGGERSMAHAVKMFNAKHNTNITESQGWDFMISLKNARMAAGGFNPDDYLDAVAYQALLAECVLRERGVTLDGKGQ